jgi:putative two-component system response regulator
MNFYIECPLGNSTGLRVNDDIDRHGRRTAWLSTHLCTVLDMSAQQTFDVALAALTHDIGKHALPVELLDKPSALTANERRSIERHCMLGVDRLMLDAEPDTPDSTSAAIAVALSHHEWWNGGGYPFGLAGTSIPRYARVVAVADVFDALMSSRPYKSAWSLGQTIEYIVRLRAIQFDPECVDAMLVVAQALPADWMAAGEACSVASLPARAAQAPRARQAPLPGHSAAPAPGLA